MTFPTSTISTANVSSGTSDPSLARADILALIQAVNNMITSANAASGVPTLTANSQIRAEQVPSELRLQSGIQIIAPVSEIVNIRNILRMATRTVAQLRALEDSVAQPGDIAYCSDGDAGGPCLAVFTGLEWQVCRLMATIGDAPAAVTASATLSCTAD